MLLASTRGYTGSKVAECFRGSGGVTVPQATRLASANAAADLEKRRCMSVPDHRLLFMNLSMPSTAEMALELIS